MSTRLSRRSGVTAATALLGLLPVLAACGGPPPTPSSAPDDAGLTIVASTTVWSSVAAAVAGPDARVDSIIEDATGDPHSYEATPADAAAITGADLVVFNGGHYDEFVAQALAADPEAAARSVDAFSLHEGDGEQAGGTASGHAPDEDGHAHGDEAHAHGQDGHGDGEEGHAHDGGGANEHVWFAPATVATVAREIGARLGQAQPDRAADFTARAEAFARDVEQIGIELAGIGQARPGVRAVSSEPVSLYLQQTAGITDVTPPSYLQAVLSENEPPALGVAETTTLLGARGADLLFYNPQTSTASTQSVRAAAEQAGVPVVEVAETPPPDTDYLQWLSGYRTQIATALGVAP